MTATILFILILSFLVLIHELGHYLAARWAKIKIHEFGLGYPPKAITLFKHNGTPFTLNWIPFGGFVRMEGEDGVPDETVTEPTQTTKKEKEAPFYTRSSFERLVVILAGVAVNFVFGIIAFTIVYAVQGIPTLINEARIGAVAENSPAAEAGIPVNVNVIAIKDGVDTIPVSTNEEVIEAVSVRAGKEITLVTTGTCSGTTCQESATEFTTYVRTAEEIPEGEGAIGIAFTDQVFLFYPWYEQLFRGIVVGVQQAVLFGVFILLSLFDLVKNMVQFGQVPGDVAGPVGIVHQAQTQGLFQQGWIMILNFTGLLSVNLAIMNLLPIPALDGGRALFILLEKVIGKHRVQKVEGYANYGGFMLLIGLIVLITARDIWRLFA
jgi:regulator of sigma E protease